MREPHFDELMVLNLLFSIFTDLVVVVVFFFFFWGEAPNDTLHLSTPFKKSNATRLWSIIFLLPWIYIHQVRYPWKACLFAFRVMPYLLGLFHWGVCRVSKLGAMSKRKSCKIHRIVWEMHAMSSFVLPFCERMHTYPLPIHCAEILRNNTSCWISNSGAILEH